MNSHNFADVVLFNGNIYTVNPNQPVAEGVAIRDDKIVMVGSTDEVKAVNGFL